MVIELTREEVEMILAKREEEKQEQERERQRRFKLEAAKQAMFHAYEEIVRCGGEVSIEGALLTDVRLTKKGIKFTVGK